MINSEKIHIVNFSPLNDNENFFELIKLSYNHLKLYLYYDKFPLIYRQYLSDFESIGDIDLELRKIATHLKFLINPEDQNSNNTRSKILEHITYIPFPKKILSPLDNSEENGSIQLITNDRKFSEYYLDKFELFIDTKCQDSSSSAISFVTIQIIGIMWTYYIGVVLDDSLDPSCYGSRIKPEFKTNPKVSKYIYNRYFDKYTEWRDKGLNVAQNLLDVEKRDALIISLDVTRFYYSVSLNFDEIKNDYDNEIKTNYSYLSHFLQKNKCFIQNIHKVLQGIHEKYSQSIEELLPIIHKSNQSPKSIILPIGLISSGIIGNWYLKNTDREIIRQYNPDYYGRYVDDMLIVIKSSDQIKKLINNCSDDNSRIFEILKHQFSLQNENSNCENLQKNQILKYNDDKGKKPFNLYSFRTSDSLNIEPRPSVLTIQIEKTRIYHLEKDSSRAVLSKLKKTIQKNASFFRFLPDNDWDVSLDEVAYDIISKGSIHKIRNIVDVSENDYELVKYLSSISIKYKLCCLKEDEINKVVVQLFHFFNGVNIIKHFKLWERIFSILFLFNKQDEIIVFYKLCKSEIYKINLKSFIINSVLKGDLSELLEERRDFDKEIINSSIRNSIEYQIQYHKNGDKNVPFNELMFKNKREFISETSSRIKSRCLRDLIIFDEKDQRLSEFLGKYYESDQKYLKLLESVTNSLLKSLCLSLSLPMGLLALDQSSNQPEIRENLSKKQKNHERFYYNLKLLENAKKFRKSNLIREQYIVYPLINLISSEKSSLIDYKKLYSYKFGNTSQGQNILDQAIFKYPSKIYHLWEYLLLLHYIKFSHNKSEYFSLLSDFFDDNSHLSKKSTIESESQIITETKKWINVFPTKSSVDEDLIIEEYYFPHEKEKTQLKIGIAHLQTDEIDLNNNLKGDTNISIERQNNLYSILNNAEKLGCDLLIFPELSIPIYWLPFMVAHSKRHQIGIIFGLEHWSVQTEEEQNYAYNFAVSVLPFKEHDVYNDCLVTIRKKNHYAPLEEKQINEARIEIPPTKKNIYHIFHWRGASFTVFNCYELADINHKAQFRSKIDFLVAIEYNKDTPYFSNIVESISRDLHCYVIQVNIPKFGDSRIIQPKRSELRDLACISGGENCTLLVATIDIKSLRDFQQQDKFCGDGEFKPLPPGFNPKDVKQRGKLEKDINKNDSPIFVKRS